MPSTSKEEASAEIDVKSSEGSVKAEGAEFKFDREPSDQRIKHLIIESYKKHAKKNATLTKLTGKMKKDLDKSFPRGWIVFAGKHMVGACSYVEKTLVNFEVNGVSFVVFQTYFPGKSQS